MPKKSCIYGTSREVNLAEGDRIELIELYEEILSDNIDAFINKTGKAPSPAVTALLEKISTQDAVQTLAVSTLSERKALLKDIKKEDSTIQVPVREINFPDVPDLPGPETSKLVREEAPIPDMRKLGIGNTLRIIQDSIQLEEDSLLNEHKERLINILTKLPETYTDKQYNFIQKQINTLFNTYNQKSSRFREVQIGLHTQDKTTGKLNRDIARDNLKANKSEQFKRKSFKDYFNLVESKINSIFNSTANVFLSIRNSETRAKIVERLGLNEGQEVAMRKLATFANIFEQALSTNPDKNVFDLLLKQDVYYHDLEGDKYNKGNPFGYLIQVDQNGDRYLNTNLIGIMATISYQWLGTQGQSTLFNDRDTIARYLGRDEDTYIEASTIEALRNVGAPRNAVAEVLGKQVFKHLGLEVKTKDVDGDFQARLEIAIGLAMINVMLDNGFLQHNPISAKDMKAYGDSSIAQVNENSQANFISIANISNEEAFSGLSPAPHVQEIIDLFKTEKDFTKKLVEQNPFTLGPVFTKPVKESRKVKGIPFLNVTSKLNKQINKLQEVEWGIKRNVTDVLSFLGKDMVFQIEGYKKDLSQEHISKHHNIEGKNRSIERDVNNLFDFLDQQGDSKDPFYFEYDVVKNTRVQIASNTINPQTSKTHRHAIGAKNWTVEINNPLLLNHFKAAVMQGFGYSIDKQTTTNINEAFDELVNDPVIKRGLAGIRAIKKGTATSKHKQNIVAAVEKGGENMASLDALINLAEYSHKNPYKSFTTNIGIETDGITNGVAIGLMQTMLEPNIENRLAAAGIFTDTKNASYGEYRQNPINKDNYEFLAFSWNRQLVDMYNKGTLSGKDRAFLSNIFGPLIETKNNQNIVTNIGRALSKSPLMTTNYGAGIKRIKELLADSAVEKFYDKLVQAETQEDIETLINNFNTFTGTTNPVPLKADILTYEIEFDNLNVFKDKVKKSYGQALDTALNQQFAKFKEVRQSLTNAYAAMFEIFKLKLDQALKEKLKEKNKNILAGERQLALNEQEKLEVIKKVAKYLPAINSYSSEEVLDRLLMMKTDRKRDYGNSAKGVKVGSSRPINNSKNLYKGGIESSSTSGTISELIFKEAGVSGVVTAIQAMDSAIIAESFGNYDMLNIFDAGIYSIKDVVNATGKYNKSFYQVTKNYNIVKETLKTIDSLQALLNKQPNLKRKVNGAIQRNKNIKNKSSIQNIREDLIEQLNKIEAAQKKVKIFSVSQASYPDSNYFVNVPKQGTREEAVDDFLDQVKADPDQLELFSSGVRSIDFDNFTASYVESLTSENSVDIFDKLEADNYGPKRETLERQNYLKGLLNNLVNRVINPLDGTGLELDFQINRQGDIVHGGIKEEKIRIHAGRGLRGDLNQMSAQEVYLHELIHAITYAGIQTNFYARRELERLFENVKSKTTYKDFLPIDPSTGRKTTDPDEIAAAEQRYNYIFHNKRGKSLHEFMAFGLTNERFGNVLASLPPLKSTKVPFEFNNIKEWLLNLFDRVLQSIASTIQKTSGKTPDQALLQLAENVTGINAKNHSKILAFMDRFHSLNPKLISRLNRHVFAPLNNWHEQHKNDIDQSIAKKAALKTIDHTKTIAQAARGEGLYYAINQTRRLLNLTEKNFLVKLVRELTGPDPDTREFYDLLRYSKKFIDQGRRHIAENVKSDLRDSYGRKLTKEESTAINKILLKTDLVSYYDSLINKEDIIDLLRSDVLINTEIDRIETFLKNTYGKNGNYYSKQAHSLGHLMARGNALVEDPMYNAYNIAQLTAVDPNLATGNLQQAEEHIDQLATLYAIKYTKREYRAITANVIQEQWERSRTANGIIHTINIHRGFKKKSLEELFKNNKALTAKGYTAEILNPDIDYVIGTRADEERYVAEGYEPYKELKKDKNDPAYDPTNPPVIYITKSNLLNPYVKGISSLTNKKAKGTTLYQAYVNSGNLNAGVDAILATDTLKRRNAHQLRHQFSNSRLNTNPNNNFAVPIVNEQGQIVEYRYIMSELMKDEVLEKDNNFATVLGRMEGAIVDKINTKSINRQTLQLLHDDYVKNYASDPSSFVKVGKNSEDPRYKEIYAMMPEDMKYDMEGIWGGQNIQVREELMDLVFGFRKVSITEMGFLKNLNTPEANQSVFKDAYQNLKIDAGIKLAERIWQEVVGAAKDYIVIKSFVVLKDNVISNNWLLWTKGVPLGDIGKNQALALASVTAYRDDLNQRDKLQRKLEVTQGLSPQEISDLEDKILKYNERLKTNPIRDLIDEGVFQNIIEDVSLDEDVFTYRNRLQHKLETFTNKHVNKNVMEVFKQVYMTRDTFLYQKLLQATQYSDFVARYTLYQHNLSKGMSKKDAITDVIDTFVNYDVPTSPALQYLNDMGILMFTKFLLRIQRIILRTIKQNPVNVLTLQVAQESFNWDTPEIADSIPAPGYIFNRAVNTLPGIPKSATELAGVNIATYPF